MYDSDTPERDVNRHDENQTKPSPQDNCSVGCENRKLCGSSRKAHSRPTSVREQPLFTLDENSSGRCELFGRSPVEEKAGLTRVCDAESARRDRDSPSSGRSPISGASGNQQKSSVARSSPPTNSDTDCGQTPCDVPPFKLLSEESASCGKSWAAWTDSATAVDIKDAPSPSSFGVCLDNEAYTSTDRPSNAASNTAIPMFSLTPPTVNISPLLNDGKDDACSQGSSSLFAVEKAPAIETDLYLTANESSSNVSVTPPKKSRINAAGVEVSSDGSGKDRRCPAAVDAVSYTHLTLPTIYSV